MTKVKSSVPLRQIDSAVYLADWFAKLCETNNKTFMPLFFDEHRYLVLKGGGGSGKSVFAARKVVERASCEPGHRFLVCRKVARTLRESCFRLICAHIVNFYPTGTARIYTGDMRIVFSSGSEIIFAGLDDVEKLKSIYEITDVWVEEATEITRDDYSQLKIRMRGKSPYYRQMILTFNPISIMHWLKAEFFDKKSAKVRTHESTYLDNRFLSKEDRETLEDFRDTDEYYYNVYCLGMWGVTGKTVFNAKILTERFLNLPKPVCYGIFDIEYAAEQIGAYRFRESCEKVTDGLIKVFVRPVDGVPYVIGADTAGDGSDSFVAQVLDNRTGLQVAMFRRSTDEDVFAHQLYCLGRWYNDALVAVETNFSTYVVRELQRLNYPKQYVRERMDDYTKSVERSFGFRTDTKTRPVLIAGLVKVARENPELICDDITIGEMLTFVHDDKTYKPQAEEGAHDDCVISLAIAHFIRPHQEVLGPEPERKRVKWHPSQWEDYRRASADERAMLITKWGLPEGM